MKQVKSPCGRSHNGPGVGVHRIEPIQRAKEGRRVEPETVQGHGHGVKWTLERYAGESSQVPTPLETPRESTLGQ